jgi:hypothetical protein
MSKYSFHTEPLGIDTSSTINYDMRELMQGIAQELRTISWAVMGKEVRGAIFVSIDPDDKIVTHGSMVSQEYGNEPASPDNYLWVVLDQLDNAYRARFLTPDSVSKISPSDMSSSRPEIPLENHALQMATAMIEAVATKNFFKGVRYGIFGTVIFTVLIALLCALVF